MYIFHSCGAGAGAIRLQLRTTDALLTTTSISSSSSNVTAGRGRASHTANCAASSVARRSLAVEHNRTLTLARAMNN